MRADEDSVEEGDIRVRVGNNCCSCQDYKCQKAVSVAATDNAGKYRAWVLYEITTIDLFIISLLNRTSIVYSKKK